MAHMILQHCNKRVCRVLLFLFFPVYKIDTRFTWLSSYFSGCFLRGPLPNFRPYIALLFPENSSSPPPAPLSRRPDPPLQSLVHRPCIPPPLWAGIHPLLAPRTSRLPFWTGEGGGGGGGVQFRSLSNAISWNFFEVYSSLLV